MPEYLTLADVANREDPNGSMAKIAEILTKEQPILEDMPFIKANDKTGHKSTVRTGLPKGTWRKLNYGVQPEKSRTAQVRDACGMLETYSVVDKALADMSGDKAGFLMSESKAFLEGMAQTMATDVIYGDSSVAPERFTGLAPRFNTMVEADAKNARNIVDGGGAGSDNTSMWLIVFDEDTVFGVYPEGSKAGLQKGETKQETLTDDAGGFYEGYRTHFKWDIGMVVRDWRYIVRVANIDISDLNKTGATGADLVDLMIQAEELIPNLSKGRAVWYCNRTIRSFLRRQITNRDNVHLTYDNVGGKRILMFGEIPVKRLDSILNTEARVV